MIDGKALTSGGSPNFLDILNNFKSTQLVEDNLLAQWKERGNKIIFYGDDTWEKLFPDAFTRSEGTTSFFATVTSLINHETDRVRKRWKSIPMSPDTLIENSTTGIGTS